MTGFQGADTAQLRETATLFTQRSDVLRETGENALRLVQAVAWVGPDADAFRAECASTVAQLLALAARTGERGADLVQEADQQDTVSAPTSGGGGGGLGAWQPGDGLLPKIAPWLFGPQEPSTFKERAWKVVKDFTKGETWNEVGESVGKLLERGGAKKFLVNLGRKGIPAVPDLYDAYSHATKGETIEFTMAMTRAVYDFHPIAGPVEAVTGLAFPLAPDHWKFPGTDRSINEGSAFDHLEKTMLDTAKSDPDMRHVEKMREGENYGLEISDRLGIENESARNVFKSLGGASGLVGSSQQGKDGNAWYIGKDMPPFG